MKTVSEKVIKANQRNGRKGKGPVTPKGKRSSSLNALKHGLLAKVLTFANEEEKADLKQFQTKLTDQLNSTDLVESTLVEEIVANLWKLQNCLGWEIEAADARKRLSGFAIKAFVAKNSELDLDDIERAPLFGGSEDALERTSSAWDCTEMSIETDYSKDDSEHSRSQSGRSTDNAERSQTGGKQTEVSFREGKLKGSEQAARTHTAVKLESSLDTILRYERAIKRDLYRAMEALNRWRAKKSAD